MRAAALADACGRFLPALIVHDLRDRLHGRHARAAARWGRLERPQASARVVWVVSGKSRASVRLGVELARALAERRSDIALLLTYETEYADLLAPLAGSPRIGWGYGPSDYIGAVEAANKRLLPFGIVVAGVVPRPNLLALCEASRHALLVAPPEPVHARVERIYPTPEAPCSGASCAPPADLDALLHEPAADDTTVTALAGAAAPRLWCWHGDDTAAAKRLFALVRGHLPQDLLVVSGSAATALAAESEAVQRLSRWDRVPVEPGTLLAADEPGWLAALAPGLRGIHFAATDPGAVWTAAAAGAIVSMPPDAPCPGVGLAQAVLRVDDENALVACWKQLAADEEARARARSALLAAHAAEQERARANAAELIERVCRWR